MDKSNIWWRVIGLAGWLFTPEKILGYITSFATYFVGLWQGKGMTELFALALVGLACGLVIGNQLKDRSLRWFKDRPSYQAIEFFPTREELDKVHPLSETFQTGNEIYAYFLSGDGVFPARSDYIRNVKRLILPDPASENISTIEEFSNNASDYQQQIRKYYNLAKTNNVSVRIFRNFIGVSLLFCNPDRPEGWVHVSPIIPGAEPHDRHHYRLYRDKNEKAFQALYEAFQILWAKSEEVLPEEKYIYVHDAVTQLYEAHQQRTIRLPDLDNLSGSQDDIYSCVANKIAESDGLEILARKAPSREHVIINYSRTKRDFKFMMLATRLVNRKNDHIFFMDLRIDREEFKQWCGFEFGLQL